MDDINAIEEEMKKAREAHIIVHLDRIATALERLLKISEMSL